jgi:hypothetical protein
VQAPVRCEGNCIGMRRSITTGALVVGLFGSALADQGPTEEELVAPLVMKQNCWGGIIRFILDNERFEVDDAVCGDGNYYHLEFDVSLRMVAKRWVRKPYSASR